jgi:hypothetical protein
MGLLTLIGYVLVRVEHLPAVLGGEIVEFRICLSDQG